MSGPSAGSRTVCVVGGGPTGLALAYHLRHAADVRVLEADTAPGGYVRTLTIDGWRVEKGPHALVDREPATLRLAEALGLSVLRPPKGGWRRYVLRRGKLLALAPHNLLLGRLASWPALVRAALEPVVPACPDPDESLDAFVRRRLGAGILPLVDAAASGIYAGDPARLTVGSAFPRLFAMERDRGSILRGLWAARRAPKPAIMSFAGGVGTLSAALAAQLGERVLLGARVESLAWADGRWRIVSTRGELEAEAVVLAIPADAMAHLVTPLDAAAGEALAGIPFAPLVLADLGYDLTALGAWRGFGFLAPADEHAGILGAQWIYSMFPETAPAGRGLITVFLGGARDPGILDLDDAQIVDRAHAALVQAMGLASPPVWWHVQRHPRAVPQYERGHLARVAACDAAQARLPGLWLAGNSLRGVGVNECLRHAEELASRVQAYLGSTD